MPELIQSEIRGFEVGTRRKRQWTLDGDINGRITLDQYVALVEQFIFRTSQNVLQEELRKGFPEDYVEITDGKLGKPAREVDIRRRGSIEYNAGQTVTELVNFIFQQLKLRSPVQTGRYERSHIILLNGKEVADNLPEALQWANSVNLNQGDTIEFINVQPYSRKLERLGVTSQNRRPRIRKASRRSRAMGYNRVAKPNGVYFLTAQLAKKTFGKAANLKFEYRQGESILGSKARSFGAKSSRTTFKRDGRPYLYPTIIVRVDKQGFKS